MPTMTQLHVLKKTLPGPGPKPEVQVVPVVVVGLMVLLDIYLLSSIIYVDV